MYIYVRLVLAIKISYSNRTQYEYGHSTDVKSPGANTDSLTSSGSRYGIIRTNTAVVFTSI